MENGGQIRRLIHEALGLWQKYSVLKFRETADPKADIRIMFARGAHGDGYSFDGPGKVLAHAFYPGTVRGGDAHFDSDEEWVFDRVRKNDDYNTNFFGVALHEFGHSLGLGHSSVPDSVMFAWYKPHADDLAVDDINGINQLYKNPEKAKEWGPIYPDQRPPTRPRPTPHYHQPTKSIYSNEVTHYPERPTYIPRPRPTTTTTRAPPPRRPTYPSTQKPAATDGKPESCNTSYDAIGMIRRELFIFKGRYMWRFNQNEQVMAGYPVEIARLWKGLPKDFTKIDAVYEDKKSRIIFFVGKHYYVFNTNELAFYAPLTHLGLPEHLDKINAIFKWGHNNRTFIFSGSQYWRYDEDSSLVESDYPRNIQDYWRGVYRPDTAFQWKDGKTYFFEKKVFYQFNDMNMTLLRNQPRLSSQFWMKCPATEEDIKTILVLQRTQKYTELENSAASRQISSNILLFIISLVFARFYL